MAATPPWVGMYIDGATMQEVADFEEVSREAIRQRLLKLGIPSRSAKETRRLQVQRFVSEQGQTVADCFLQLRSVEHVGKELGFEVSLVQACVRALVPDFQVLARAPREPAKRYSDDELLGYLRAAAGDALTALTGDAFEAAVRLSWPHGESRRPPSKQVYAIRFGSWRGALEAAGLPANPTTHVPKTFDRPAMGIEAIAACWLEIGEPPTVQDYESWGPGPRGFPSSATLRAMLPDRSWNAGLLKAWQVVHGIILDQNDSDAEVPEDLAARIEYPAYVQADDQLELQALPADVKDYNALERAVRSHAELQNAFAAELVHQGLPPLSPRESPPFFDVGFRVGSTFVVAEIKSATTSNLEFQMRIGLGQVLRYAHSLLVRHQLVKTAIVVELEPDEGWKSLLYDLGIHLVWKRDLAAGVSSMVEALQIEESLQARVGLPNP